MGDNDTMACPIQSFPSAEFPSTNSNLYNSDNQNSLAQNDDKKESFGTKENVSTPLNFPTLSLPKKFDESQDSQDELPNPDLHNGHNNPDAINIAHRGKSIGELLQESEEPQDPALMDAYPKGEHNSEKPKEETNEGVAMEQEQTTSASQNSQGESTEQEKAQEDSVSQDFFEDSKQSSNDKNNQSNSNQDTENSEGFDLHLSETQSFLPSTEKENEVQTVSLESEDESQNETVNEKAGSAGGEDVDFSNGSSSNQEADSPKQTEQEVPKSNGETENTDNEKAEAIKPESEESLSNGEIGVTKAEEKEHEDKSLDSENAGKDELKDEKKIAEESVEESSIKEEKIVPEATRVSSRQQQRKQRKEEEIKEDEKEQKPEEMEVESSPNEAPEEEEAEDTSCSCEPTCHTRIKKVSQHLNSACSQLDEFIKLKRRDENKVLKSFLEMLKEISSISENKEIKGETKISDHVLIPDTSSKRKASKRKSNDLDTPLKETPRKRAAEEKTTKKSAEKEKKSSVDFKDLKGLAVFAKWPNSGWYYPGKVEELTGSDWKDVSNVTVKFYDGLVRDMKNINILPAHLIPPGSSLCDLEDETEMVVVSCDGSNQNSVDFKLSTKESSEEIELNFNKLAIRANHMKTIKQQLESITDVASKKMHMVSLDNLVSGRRSRGRSKKEDSDTEEKTSAQSERRSRSSSSTTPAKKVGTPRRARN